MRCRDRLIRSGRYALAALLPVLASPAWSQTSDTIRLRGKDQTLQIYGARGGDPVVISSGDGGWIHLAPHVAQVLAARGCFVVGFDVRAYLASFTSAKATLRTDDEPGDYRTLAEFASRGTAK